jgi:hypothetical protein
MTRLKVLAATEISGKSFHFVGGKFFSRNPFAPSGTSSSAFAPGVRFALPPV